MADGAEALPRFHFFGVVRARLDHWPLRNPQSRRRLSSLACVALRAARGMKRCLFTVRDPRSAVHHSSKELSPIVNRPTSVQGHVAAEWKTECS